jgi:hypothetical protein
MCVTLTMGILAGRLEAFSGDEDEIDMGVLN